MELVRGRAEETRRAARRSGCRPTLPAVPGRPGGIHRAVLNIVSNALDAVEGQDDPYRRACRRCWSRAASGRESSCVDNGPGIPPEKVDDIFKPFVSTKGSRGTGLGLPVSRKILREHGGDIVVQSKLGKGSKFILRLPLRTAAGGELHQTSHVKALPPEEE